jgi:biotin synthase
MTRSELITWLREEDPTRLTELWTRADAVRHANVGDEVHLRGLIEISNHCVRRCAYCGINSENQKVTRYRMAASEIAECARLASSLGYGTVVLQAGEDYGITREWMTSLVGSIKTETGLAVTLSLGERPDADLLVWRAAGADRYLLRFETSDPELYERIHPSLPDRRSDRFAILARLRELDYEVGSGIMIGIPGQTWASLAADIETFASLDLDMIGVGPFIPHPATPLGRDELLLTPAGEQVPNTELQTYKVVALTRIVRPDANIPSTTALATLNLDQGRELGLQRGANIVMPNLTPTKYRKLYEIYPAKACLFETAQECAGCLDGRIRSIGRTPGRGPGRRLRT